uniref:Uncharacterized protein n=1 Tax=Parascaris equorum TaxID=6256 RepID=A0A914RDB3_PAREQ
MKKYKSLVGSERYIDRDLAHLNTWGISSLGHLNMRGHLLTVHSIGLYVQLVYRHMHPHPARCTNMLGSQLQHLLVNAGSRAKTARFCGSGPPRDDLLEPMESAAQDNPELRIFDSSDLPQHRGDFTSQHAIMVRSRQFAE